MEYVGEPGTLGASDYLKHMSELLQHLAELGSRKQQWDKEEIGTQRPATSKRPEKR